MITPQEYTMNGMHRQQISDIENNMGEVIKKKLHDYEVRLVKLEDKCKETSMKCVFECCNCLEAVCLWVVVIMLSIKVFHT